METVDQTSTATDRSESVGTIELDLLIDDKRFDPRKELSRCTTMAGRDHVSGMLIARPENRVDNDEMKLLISDMRVSFGCANVQI